MRHAKSLGISRAGRRTSLVTRACYSKNRVSSASRFGVATYARLSSLGREVDVTPLRGQSAEQLRRDDAECTAWTRATKGANEPFDYAELR
jgi:hypothetical protein